MSIGIPLARSRHAAATWVVVAPHADDETIGAGALIAETAAARRLAALVYLTDGSGSHPLGGAVTRAALIRCRAREAALAVRRLGYRRAPLFLGWQDSHPPAPGCVSYGVAVRRLAAVLRARRVDAVAVTAGDETHGDHVAAHALVLAAVAAARRPIAVFVYRVWGGAMPRTARAPLVTRPMPVGRRRHALAAHRSQMTAALGPGFRVPAFLRRVAARDRLYPETRHAT